VSRALHVPEELAAEYRAGKEWSRDKENAEVRESKWFHKALEQVDEMVEGLERAKDVDMMRTRDYELLRS
jgi:gamma-butyrobetaine dioxygenase